VLEPAASTDSWSVADRPRCLTPNGADAPNGQCDPVGKARGSFGTLGSQAMDEEPDESRRQELEDLRQLDYHRSRIPALDALEMFVPEDTGPDPALKEMKARIGFSRWKPVEGGH
jgi:hypothetical protein